MITEGKLNKLKFELQKRIVPEEDSVCIYEIENIKYTRKESIGVIKREDNVI